MIDGCQARREDKAFAVSWYVSNLMNIRKFTLIRDTTENTTAVPYIPMQMVT